MNSPYGDGTGTHNRVVMGPFPFSLPIITLLALDPGGTTGWAKVTNRYTSEGFDPHHLVFSSGQVGPHEHHKELYKLMHTHDCVTVICESFEFRQMGEDTKKKVELISREYIGVAKLWCDQWDRDIVFQTASTAKALIPDKGPEADRKLKQLGLYVPGQKHARDAYRHLIRYMLVSDRKFKNYFAERWIND